MKQEDTEALSDLRDDLCCDEFIDGDEKVLDQVNELARLLYSCNGYQVEKGYDFEAATHPQERGMWAKALVAFNYVRSLKDET